MICENEEEKQVVIKLCDLALKAGGLQNMQAVLDIMNNIKVKEEETNGASDTKPGTK